MITRTLRWIAFLSVLTLPLWPAAATLAATTPTVNLLIQKRAFQPSTLTLPAGVQVKIVIANKDAIPAEFESYDLNREKVVPGGSTVPVYVGPLKPGTYKFFNDFHPSSKGQLVVK